MKATGSAPLHLLSAAEAAERIRAGTLTSEALVRACLERIAEREPSIHAWTHLDPEAALAQARARDTEAAQGPLHGVPVGVKDIIDTADMPTAYGSAIYDGHRPVQDAACVARLREAGAVILGKTATTEFALFTPTATENPAAPGRTPGGSSSGSAAAVADGHVPLALGTQTAGSVVRPASFCGIYGLKPTFDAIPTTGVKPCSPSLDTVGVFARDAGDLALAAAVMAGGDAWPLLKGSPRVGFARTHQWDQADRSTQRALEQLAGGLAEITLPEVLADAVDAQLAVMEYETVRALATERAQHDDLLSRGLRERLNTYERRTEADYRGAKGTAAACLQALDAIWAQVDVLLAPSVIAEAPESLVATGDPVFCRAWTLLGNPTVSVPLLTGPHGAPLGVQIIAPHGEDASAVAAAGQLATAR